MLDTAVAFKDCCKDENRNVAIKAILTLSRQAANIKNSLNFSPSERPRRLAWPRTSPFHGGNTGSNPVGDAKLDEELFQRHRLRSKLLKNRQ